MVNTRRNGLPRIEEQRDGVTASVTPNPNEHVPTPVPAAQPQPANSRQSVSSAAQIAELQGALKQRDEKLERLEEIIRAAGLLNNPGNEGGARNDTEAESRVVRPKEVHNDTTRQGSTFKTFMSCKPPTFKGGVDPLLCTRWIRKMEQTFESGDFTKKQQVCYAIRMLEGEALEWWDSVDQTMTATAKENLTWKTFAGRVKNRYCNEAAVHRAEREFLRLEKGSMSIAKYNTTFTEKLQFTRSLCPDEATMIRRYVEGLPYEYRAIVRMKTTIEAAMEEAQRMEDDLPDKDRHASRGLEKRKREESFESSKKKKVGNSRNNERPEYCVKCRSTHHGPCSKDTVKCRRCGKIGHVFTDCKSPDPICYNCREMGHISTNCPKLKDAADGKKNNYPKATARAFQMTVDEAVPERSL